MWPPWPTNREYSGLNAYIPTILTLTQLMLPWSDCTRLLLPDVRAGGVVCQGANQPIMT